MSDFFNWLSATFFNYVGLGDFLFGVILIFADKVLSRRFPRLMDKKVPMRGYILLSAFFFVVLITSFMSWHSAQQKVFNKQMELYTGFIGEKTRRVDTYRSMYQEMQLCKFDSTARNYPNDADPSFGVDLLNAVPRDQQDVHEFEKQLNEEDADFAKILAGIRLSFRRSSKLDSMITAVSVLPKYDIIEPTKHDIARKGALVILANQSNAKLEKFIQQKVVPPLDNLDNYLQQEFQK